MASEYCTPFFKACKPGKQPRAPGLATALDPNNDCVELVCPPVLKYDSLSCLGCQVGEYNASGVCSACPQGSFLCPGFLPIPLPNSTDLLAQALAPGSNPACVAASLIPPQAPNSLLPATAASILESAPFIIAVSVGSAGTLLLLLYCFAKRSKVAQLQAGGGGLQAFFRNLDFFFNINTAELKDEERKSWRFCCSSRSASLTGASSKGGPGPRPPSKGEVQGRPTALGGLYTALFAFTLVGLVLWQLISFAFSNTSVSVTPNQLQQGRAGQFSHLPWAAPRGAVVDALLPPLPPRASLQLRVLGASGLGCDALAPYGKKPLGGGETFLFSSPTAPSDEMKMGMWQVSNASCGGGRGGGSDLTLLLLTCVNCELSATSFVSFNLPFTCQALVLEALAVDANGDMRTLAFPREEPLLASSPSNSSFLATVTWTLAATLTLVQDGVGSGQSARGYRLVTSAAAVTTISPKTENVGGGVLPLANQVVIRVNLPLQALYYTTTLAPTSSPLQLVSALVGLLGILGLFKVLFEGSKWLRKTALARKLLGDSSSYRPEEPKEESSASAVRMNPLYAHSEGSAAAAEAAEAAAVAVGVPSDSAVGAAGPAAAVAEERLQAPHSPLKLAALLATAKAKQSIESAGVAALEAAPLPPSPLPLPLLPLPPPLKPAFLLAAVHAQQSEAIVLRRW